MLELPDNLVPRRGSDMTPRDYADVIASAVGAVPEEALPAEIDHLDTLTLGAPARDLMVADEDGIPGLNAKQSSEDDAPAMLALGMLRMLLRTRQLALQHEPENADQHVRELARKWAEIFAEHDRQLHGGDE